MAEDAVKVAPHVYKVLFENEHVRLLDVQMGAGGSTEMHSHPNTLIYTLDGGTVTFTATSGEVDEVAVPAGSSMWMDGTDHATNNVGGTPIHALLFEPK